MPHHRFRDFQPLPVAKDQVDEVVVALVQRSTGYQVVSLLDGAIAVVQDVSPKGGICALLSEFWESPAQIGLVEVLPKRQQNYLGASAPPPTADLRRCRSQL